MDEAAQPSIPESRETHHRRAGRSVTTGRGHLPRRSLSPRRVSPSLRRGRGGGGASLSGLRRRPRPPRARLGPGHRRRFLLHFHIISAIIVLIAERLSAPTPFLPRRGTLLAQVRPELLLNGSDGLPHRTPCLRSGSTAGRGDLPTAAGGGEWCCCNHQRQPPRPVTQAAESYLRYDDCRCRELQLLLVAAVVELCCYCCRRCCCSQLQLLQVL